MTGHGVTLWTASLDAVVATLLAGGVGAERIRALVDNSLDRAEATR